MCENKLLLIFIGDERDIYDHVEIKCLDTSDKEVVED